ncbi:VC0807 family protein [Actinomycetes bacterium KLBMP 9797]
MGCRPWPTTRAEGLGVDAWLALVCGGTTALLRVGYVAVTRRRFAGLAALVVAAFTLLLAASLLTGDPRILLTRESMLSGSLGLVLLGSCAFRRPVMYSFMRRVNSGNAALLARWDELWRTQPPFRRVFTLMSAVWGAGLLAEAIVRIPLIYLLPIDAAAGVSTLLQLGTIGLLVGWSLWYRGRRLRTAAAKAPTTLREVRHAR